MNRETETCQNCKKDFSIEPEDFKFYLPRLDCRVKAGEKI